MSRLAVLAVIVAAATATVAVGCGATVTGDPGTENNNGGNNGGGGRRLAVAVGGGGGGGGGGGLSPDGGISGAAPDAPPSGGADAGGSTLSPHTFLDRVGEKECNEAFKCEDEFPGTQTQFDDDWGTSTTDCYSLADTDLEGAATQEEVAKGNIAYDPDAAEQCLEGMTYGSCSNFFQNGASFPDICAQALVGTATKGQPCVVDYDCEGDLLCSQNTGTCVTTN